MTFKPILGGYFLLARKVFEGILIHKPPLWLALWVWMLCRANFKDRNKLRRGQFVTTTAEMQEAMSYKIGYRKKKPSKDQIRRAYEGFAKASMITKAKTTRGMIITICNYDFYQNPKNYETHSKDHNENTTKSKVTPHDTERMSNELKMKDNTPPISPPSDPPEPEQKKATLAPNEFPVTEPMIEYARKKKYLGDIHILTEAFITHHRAKGSKFINWYAAWQKWLQNELRYYPERNVPPGHQPLLNIKPITYAQAQDAERRQRARWLLEEMNEENNEKRCSQGNNKALSLLPDG